MIPDHAHLRNVVIIIFPDNEEQFEVYARRQDGKKLNLILGYYSLQTVTRTRINTASIHIFMASIALALYYYTHMISGQ